MTDTAELLPLLGAMRNTIIRRKGMRLDLLLPLLGAMRNPKRLLRRLRPRHVATPLRGDEEHRP